MQLIEEIETPGPATRERLRALVHAFYGGVRADPDLGPVFEQSLAHRWEPHLERMVEFWSTVMLGSKSFRGNVFGKHMALPDLTPQHFAIWVRLWREHTERLFDPQTAAELQHAANGIARNLFQGYFGHSPTGNHREPAAQP